MIELNSIIEIQSKYLSILSRYKSKMENGISDFELKCFFEELQKFWYRNDEKVRYFLKHIAFEDKCGFLAGQIYLDLKNNEHYYFSLLGKIRIINDPIIKMRAFFLKEQKIMDYNKIKKYMLPVYFNTLGLLEHYSDYFIILPLDNLSTSKLVEDTIELKKLAFDSICSMFYKEITTREDFINSFSSFDEIQKNLKVDMSVLIYNDTSDLNIDLKDRVEKYCSKRFNFSKLKKEYSEPELFIFCTELLLMQAIDIIRTSLEFSMYPFIELEVVLNYILALYPNFTKNKDIDYIYTYLIITYAFSQIYTRSDFSKINFKDFVTNIGDNKLIDCIARDNFMSEKPENFKLLIKEFCDPFLKKII